MCMKVRVLDIPWLDLGADAGRCESNQDEDPGHEGCSRHVAFLPYRCLGAGAQENQHKQFADLDAHRTAAKKDVQKACLLPVKR